MKSKSTPPVIRHIANLWTLMEHPTAKREWSPERKVADVAANGFHGITWLPDRRIADLVAKEGLIFVGFFSSAKASEFRDLIQQNIDCGAKSINVQVGDEDTPVEKSIQLAIKLIEQSEKLGAKCSVEVHRDTSTETPEKTYAIAAGFKKATGRLLPMTWDFSHLSIIKHINPPYWDRLLVDPKLLQHAEQFHFRPFNGHHCQVPVTDGKGRISRELNQWLPMLDKTLETWLAGKQDGREIFAVPELGPLNSSAIGYGLSCFPPSWDDAKVLRPIIDKAWKKALAASKK